MERVSIGGQAVLEGVMMKYKDKYAVAVRKPDKEIEVKVNSYTPGGDKHKVLKLPIIRGVNNFIESLIVGTKTLMYSSEFIEEDEEEVKKRQKKEAEKKAKKAKKTDSYEDSESETIEKKSKADELEVFGTIALSVVLAVGLFMLLPAFITGFLDEYIKSNIVLGIIEGVVRLTIFVVYIWLISKMEDIHRVYMYHGAEHKTINCFEKGLDLTVENIMKQSRFHKRCGTSFLFIVMFVSILVFMCIKTRVMWLRLVLRVLFVPIIAGISYEFIRFAGKNDSKLADFLSKPGLWIQRLTTKEPTPDMVEVAIKSVEGVFDWKAYLDEARSESNGDDK